MLLKRLGGEMKNVKLRRDGDASTWPGSVSFVDTGRRDTLDPRNASIDSEVADQVGDDHAARRGAKKQATAGRGRAAEPDHGSGGAPGPDTYHAGEDGGNCTERASVHAAGARYRCLDEPGCDVRSPEVIALFAGSRRVTAAMVVGWRRRLLSGEDFASVCRGAGVGRMTVRHYVDDLVVLGAPRGRRTIYNRGKIVELLQAGVAQIEIARTVGCTKQLVSHVWRKLQKDEDDAEQTRSERGTVADPDPARRPRPISGGLGRSSARRGAIATFRVIRGGRG